MGHSTSVLNTEVSLFQGCPLRGLPLYTTAYMQPVSSSVLHTPPSNPLHQLPAFFSINFTNLSSPELPHLQPIIIGTWFAVTKKGFNLTGLVCCIAALVELMLISIAMNSNSNPVGESERLISMRPVIHRHRDVCLQNCTLSDSVP